MKKTLFLSLIFLTSLSLSAQVLKDSSSIKNSIHNQISSSKPNQTEKRSLNISDTVSKHKEITVLGFSNNGHEPMVIIDGVRSKHGTKGLDVSNIKSISVLQGVGATKRYGKKGKYGVIIITTKNISI